MKGLSNPALWKLVKSLSSASRIKTPAIRENVRNSILEHDLISQIPNMDDEMTTKVAMALIETKYDDPKLYSKLLKRFTDTSEDAGGENGMRLVAFMSRVFPQLADWEQNEAYFDFLHKQSRLLNMEKSRFIYTFADLGKGSPNFWRQVEESVLHSIKSYEILPSKSTKQASQMLQGVYSNLLAIKMGISYLNQEVQEEIYQFLLRVLDNEEVKVSDKLNSMMMMTRRLPTARVEGLLKGYRHAKTYQPDRSWQESLNQLQNLIWRSHHLMAGQARECEADIFMGMAHITVKLFEYIGFRRTVFKTDYHSLTFAFKHGTEMFADFLATLELPADTMRPIVEFMTELTNSYHQHSQSETQKWRNAANLDCLDNPFINMFNQESSLCILLLMSCPGLAETARADLVLAVKHAVDLQDLLLTTPRRYLYAIFAIQQGISAWTIVEQRLLLQGLKAGEFGMHIAETNLRAQHPWQLKLFEDQGAKVFVFLKRLTVASIVGRECGAEAEFHDGIIGLYAECLKELGEELQSIKDQLKQGYGFGPAESEPGDEDVFLVVDASPSPEYQSSASGMRITDWKNWTRSISILSCWLSGSFTYLNTLFQSERFIDKKDHLPVLEETYSDILIHALQNLDQQKVRSAFCKFVWENSQILNHRLDMITLASILKEDLPGVSPEGWLLLYRQSNRNARKLYCLAEETTRSYFLRSLALSAALGISVLKNGVRNAYSPKHIQFSTALFEYNVTGLQVWSAETIIKNWIEKGSQDWTEPTVSLSSFGESHNAKAQDSVSRSVSPLAEKTQEQIQEDMDRLTQIVPADWKEQSAVDLLVLLNWPRPRFQEEDRFEEAQKELAEILGLKLQKLVENDYHRHLARVTIREVAKMQEEENENRRISSNPEAADYNLQDYLVNVSKFHQILDARAYLRIKKRTNLFDFDSEFSNLGLESQYHLLDNELEEYEAKFHPINADDSSGLKKSSKNMYLWGEVSSSPGFEAQDLELESSKAARNSKADSSIYSAFNAGKIRHRSDTSPSTVLQVPSQETTRLETRQEFQPPPQPTKKVGWVIGDALKRRNSKSPNGQELNEGKHDKRAPSFEKYIVQTYGREILNQVDNKPKDD